MFLSATALAALWKLSVYKQTKSSMYVCVKTKGLKIFHVEKQSLLLS